MDSAIFRAPVYLPNGVHVVELLAWVDTEVQNNVQVYLSSYKNASQLKHTMAKVRSSDRTGLAHYHYDRDTTISDNIIDNASKSYYLDVLLIDDKDELVRLHTVRIKYTYTTPDK
jgi:hypothetical protein